MPSTRVPLLFGTMTMGEAGKNGVRTADLKENQEILDTFFKHGHKELDTARMYAEGTTEPLLAKLDLKDATIDTKVYPVNPGDHAPAKLRATFETSLKLLAPYKVRVLYLHAPDRSVPSMYNAITREIEPELVPCCRKFGIRIVIYNPLAGGFFAGKVAAPDAQAPEGGRFDPSSRLGQMYRARYLKNGFFDALNLDFVSLQEKHQLLLTEIALRWCQHHSVLTPEDGIILGASSAAQLEQNLEDSEKGPLPEEVVTALDEARRIVGANVPPYWR